MRIIMTLFPIAFAFFQAIVGTHASAAGLGVLNPAAPISSPGQAAETWATQALVVRTYLESFDLDSNVARANIDSNVYKDYREPWRE